MKVHKCARPGCARDVPAGRLFCDALCARRTDRALVSRVRYLLPKPKRPALAPTTGRYSCAFCGEVTTIQKGRRYCSDQCKANYAHDRQQAMAEAARAALRAEKLSVTIPCATCQAVIKVERKRGRPRKYCNTCRRVRPSRARLVPCEVTP